MGKPRRPEPELPPNSPLAGFGYFRRIQAAIDRLHHAGTERDTAGNRQFFFDQYFSLLLLYFCNPALTSLRALQQTTGGEKVRRTLGIRATSLGSLSEAQGVFDARRLEPILRELAEQALPLTRGDEAEALRGLTAVDGTFFAGLSRMSWALWTSHQRGAKLHLHFDVLKGVPRQAVVTPAAGSEVAELAGTLEPARLYVLDRGYASYRLFAQILQARSSLVARVKDSTAYQDPQDRPLDAAARAAGVVRDLVARRLGTDHHADVVGRPIRIVVVRAPQRPGNDASDIWLATDRLDLSAELVALAYRYRWTIELFFRWLKCVLGTRHLVAESKNGLSLQLYTALIVSLLIVLRTGRAPTTRTYELIPFYLLGWVSDAEFDAHLERLAQLPSARSKKPG
jgi:hypothetical protein